MTDDRPASPSLTPRSTIRPARDENVDPIDTSPKVPASLGPQAFPAPETPRVPVPAAEVVPPLDAEPVEVQMPSRAAPARRMRAEVTVQLTSRVSEQTRDFLDDIVSQEGGTVRRAIERAIAAYALSER